MKRLWNILFFVRKGGGEYFLCFLGVFVSVNCDLQEILSLVK